jgi:DnaJ-class molecular chaperone
MICPKCNDSGLIFGNRCHVCEGHKILDEKFKKRLDFLESTSNLKTFPTKFKEGFEDMENLF